MILLILQDELFYVTFKLWTGSNSSQSCNVNLPPVSYIGVSDSNDSTCQWLPCHSPLVIVPFLSPNSLKPLDEATKMLIHSKFTKKYNETIVKPCLWRWCLNMQILSCPCTFSSRAVLYHKNNFSCHYSVMHLLLGTSHQWESSPGISGS